MKRGNALKLGIDEALSSRGRMKGLYTGLYDEAESFRVYVPETGFQLRNITIKKPRTFTVKIKAGQ